MLRGVKSRYEDKHRVRIDDGALVAAVKLGRRYVAGRALPDKAIDLLDEAGSRLRLELDSHPDEIDELARRERSLQLELAALAREKRRRSRSSGGSRLAAALDEVRGQLGPLRTKWQAELAAITALRRGPPAPWPRPARRPTTAERAGDLTRASEIRFGKLPALEQAEAEAAGQAARRPRAASGCWRTRSNRCTWPGWWPTGPASRRRGCWRASARRSWTSRTTCASG